MSQENETVRILLSHFIDLIIHLLRKCIRDQNNRMKNEINEYLFMENLITFKVHLDEFWQKKFNKPFEKITSDEYMKSWTDKKAEILPTVKENINEIKAKFEKMGDDYSYFK